MCLARADRSRRSVQCVRQTEKRAARRVDHASNLCVIRPRRCFVSLSFPGKQARTKVGAELLSAKFSSSHPSSRFRLENGWTHGLSVWFFVLFGFGGICLFVCLSGFFCLFFVVVVVVVFVFF